MIDGCLDWLENGLVLPEVVKQATAEYFEDEDIFGRWIAENASANPASRPRLWSFMNRGKYLPKQTVESPGSSKSLAEMLKQRGLQIQKKAEAPFTSPSG